MSGPPPSSADDRLAALTPSQRSRAERVRTALQGRMGSVVVVIEAVHRRHNASAILRSCECFGVHEVHLITRSFRPSKGAARGSERWMEVHMHPETGPVLEDLRARGFRIFVADLDDEAHTPDTVPVDAPVALLMGSEVVGVSDEARALADGAVCVPMRGLTESLNVGAAATCTLYRVAERRRAVAGADLAPERRDAFFSRWLDREVAQRTGMKARVGG
jgi:tRNA (guanosine-2'-O-)-methyltransferase